MNRRDTVLALAALGAAPLACYAQQQTGKIARIGRLSPQSAPTDSHSFEALRNGLRDLGWIEGRNIAFEYRAADGNFDRLSELAAELVRLNVDVIVSGSTPGALATKMATATIPIVMVTTGDPVASGLVSSLARPGGNLTGVTALGREMAAKRLELLKATFPGVTRVVVLVNPANPEHAPSVKRLEVAGQSLRVQVRALEIRDPAKLEQSFSTVTQERAGAIMVLTDALFINHRGRIVQLVAKSRLPAIYGFRGDVDAGGLMFYGATLADMYYRAATYVDKILKGAKPADLPVEQAAKFELVINVKTAKALGIAIPQAVLLRADRVIE